MKCGANSLCGNYLPCSIGRITRHGLPAANTPAGTSRVTTLPAPITARAPMVTPGRMIAPPPTQTSAPHHAVEVEEHALAELDVRAVVAVERWLHPDGVAAPTEQRLQNPPALGLRGFRRGVQRLYRSPASIFSRSVKAVSVNSVFFEAPC